MTGLSRIDDCSSCGVAFEVCMDLDLHCCIDCRLEGCHDPATDDAGGES